MKGRSDDPVRWLVLWALSRTGRNSESRGVSCELLSKLDYRFYFCHF
jgi:hypothetical protein